MNKWIWCQDLLLKNFISMLGSCTKIFFFFCTAIYDKMFIILMRTTLFTLQKTIAKFIISIYAIPVFHADDLWLLLDKKLSYSFSLQGGAGAP